MDTVLGVLQRQVDHGLFTNLQIAIYSFFFIVEPWCRRRLTFSPMVGRLVTNLSLAALTFSVGIWLYRLTPWSSGGHGAVLPNLISLASLPGWLGLALFIVIFDLFHYGFHYLNHRWRWLWRVHQVHHSDLEVDVTTSYRHHPLALLYALLPRLLIVVVLAPPLTYLLVYELVRVVFDPFSHADMALPARLERMLRYVVITPDMHRIHHSALKPETDSNFGAFLSVWDRLFGTYRWRPIIEQQTMQLGLEYGRDRRSQSLWGTLLAPLTLPPVDAVAVNESQSCTSSSVSVRTIGRAEGQPDWPG